MNNTTTPPSPASRDALEIEQIRTLIGQQLANQGKLQAEQEKLLRESRWYPLIAIAAFAGAVAAVAKLFFGA